MPTKTEVSAAYWARNPEKLRAKQARQHARRQANGQNRAYDLEKRYGMTVAGYEAKLAAQDWRCAVCRRPFTSSKSTHVDHDHSTNKTRGILCSNCNTAIGLLLDQSSIALAAWEYLLTWKETA